MFSKCVRLLPTARRIQYSAVGKSPKDSASALYIPGDLASDSFVVITPYIDLEKRFQNIESLQEIVLHRGLNIDVLALKNSWEKLRETEKYKISLEKKISENVALSKSLLDGEKHNADKLKQERLKLREKMKAASQELWNLERTAIIKGLSLPNRIHPDTPIENGSLVYGFSSNQSSNDSPSHLEIGKRLNLLEFYDSSFYFLKGDAAKYELGISFLFLDCFRDDGFTVMSNSDFARSVTVEGVGLDPKDSNSVFMLQKESDQPDPNIRLHLVGGASLVSFCAFLAKSVTHNSDLPLRYVTAGKHYNPGNSVGLNGLFSSWQNSAVEALVVTSNEQQMMQEFHSMLQKLIVIYCRLGYHFRIEYLPSKSLRPWESLHASVQMYSSNLKSYIEVASVSLCDDYISKRLLICCTENSQKPRQFTHIVSSTLVSVPHVLGCVLENSSDEFVVPPEILEKLHGRS